MKLTILALASSVSIASAYTLTVSNFGHSGADPDLPITDNLNMPLASGTVAVGFFASDEAVTGNRLDFSALLSGFTEYGTSSAFEPLSGISGLLNLVTPDNWAVTVAPEDDSPRIGGNIYVIIGNGDDLSSSDLLAVWKSDSLWGTDDAAGNGGAAVGLAAGSGTLLIGDDNIAGQETDVIVGANTFTFANRIGLVEAVPEPSTSLLAGLAGLGLAFRRRR